MKKHRHDLVKDSLDLLRQIRAGLANDSAHCLVVPKIDEVIVRLELLMSEDADDRDKIFEILRVFGQCLTAIPGIQRVMEILRDR